MRYEDALEECLQALRRGADLEQTLAGHPEHADRLRADLAAATGLRALAASLPRPDAASARRLQAALAERRPRGTSTRRLPAPAFALAALAAVALLAFAALSGSLGGSSAQAATLEGVVLENSGSVLALQTDTGIESVQLAKDATITDDTGATIGLEGIEPGHLLQARGNRPAQGVFAARRISLKPPAELHAWCGLDLRRCLAGAQALQQRLDLCPETSNACIRARLRLAEVRALIGAVERAQGLRRDCEQGNRATCRELIGTCRQRPELCRPFATWLRSLE
jgi:hypothetical protein